MNNLPRNSNYWKGLTRGKENTIAKFWTRILAGISQTNVMVRIYFCYIMEFYNFTFLALLSETFLFISVQSSSPVEAANYVPETLAIAQFSLKGGLCPFSEFTCGLSNDDEWASTTRRAGATYSENNLGDEDGCQARVGMQKVAKLIFQRAKKDTATDRVPLFFCLAEEFEMVYDALCDLKMRAFAKSSNERRLSVNHVATLEDLTHSLFKWFKIPLPPIIGGLQFQLYFDSMVERSDQHLVATLRCGAHESDSFTRCPKSVINLAALKIKEWIDNGGIPEQDVPLIERQAIRQHDWPVFSDHGGDYQHEIDESDEDDGDGVEIANGRRTFLPNVNIEENFAMGRREMTMAWVESQGRLHSVVTESPSVQEITASGDYVNESNADQKSSVSEVQSVRAARLLSMTGDQPLNGQLAQPQRSIQDVAPTAPTRGLLVNLSRASRLAGMGTELEFQDQLPFGARGIGRGLHLVPTYVREFQTLKAFLNS